MVGRQLEWQGAGGEETGGGWARGAGSPAQARSTADIAPAAAQSQSRLQPTRHFSSRSVDAPDRSSARPDSASLYRATRTRGTAQASTAPPGPAAQRCILLNALLSAVVRQC